MLQKKRTDSSTSRSRWKWVMRWEAFNANVNPSGVAAVQPLTVFEFGSR
jgi:predicted membrane-bound dolichyl-phosphate-mannose-protein mannosyltransferase